MKFTSSFSLTALLLSGIIFPAYAHGPTPQKTDQTALINAAPAVVWKKLSEPCAIATWHSEVSSCESATPLNRTLTLKNGGKVQEDIDEILPAEMTISYRLGGDMDVKGLPVSSLTGRIKVVAEGAGSRVSWLARYYRFDTTNEPPKGLDDESAQKAVNAYVKAALEGLERAPEKK